MHESGLKASKSGWKWMKLESMRIWTTWRPEFRLKSENLHPCLRLSDAWFVVLGQQIAKMSNTNHQSIWSKKKLLLVSTFNPKLKVSYTHNNTHTNMMSSHHTGKCFISLHKKIPIPWVSAWLSNVTKLHSIGQKTMHLQCLYKHMESSFWLYIIWKLW